MATYEGSIDSPRLGGCDRLAPIGKDIVVDTKAAGDNHWQLLEVDGAMMKLRSWAVERQPHVFIYVI